jgi:hypothetical protein
MCSPIADVGRLPQTAFVVQFQEANAEWGRPHSANPMLASQPSKSCRRMDVRQSSEAIDGRHDSSWHFSESAFYDLTTSSGSNPTAFQAISFQPPPARMGMLEYRTSAQAIFDIKYHFVWITKHRYKILRGGG